MELRHLNYFMEIARQGSFSKAGEHVHISQPTLSKMIKSLEEELDAVLFNRTTRYVQLTDDGEALMKFARSVLSSLDELESDLSDGKQLRRGHIRLGLPPVIGASFFPKIIAKFRSRYPQVHIQLVEEGGKIVEQSLLEGDLDLGVVVLPVDEDLFHTLPLVERRLQLIVHPGHPAAARAAVRLSELREEPFILFKEGFSLYDRVREACLREGFEPIIAYESSQWDFISEMVAAGLGIALLPETVCGKIDASAVKVVPDISPRIDWKLSLIWSRKHYVSNASRGWIEFIKGMAEIR